MQPIGYRIEVERPCGESWTGMTPDGAGRHCSACARTLVDFSTFSDADLLAYLRKHPGTCGRFSKRQLGRPLLFPPVPQRSVTLPKWIAGTLLVAATQTAAAQQGQLGPELPHCDDTTLSINLGNEGYVPLAADSTVLAQTDTIGIPDPDTAYILETGISDSSRLFQACLIMQMDSIRFASVLLEKAIANDYVMGFTSTVLLYPGNGLDFKVITTFPGAEANKPVATEQVEWIHPAVLLPKKQSSSLPSRRRQKPLRHEPVPAVLPAAIRVEEETDEAAAG